MYMYSNMGKDSEVQLAMAAMSEVQYSEKKTRNTCTVAVLRMSG